MNHRRDIEGLRGVAVLLVIAYHADPALMPGGYIGVDVFFVISGYLITAMLVAGPRLDGSHLRGFYDRRIRRILPALTAVMAASLAAGFFIFGPHDLQQLAKAALAVTFMGGNLYFWHQRDYFADQAPPHALLHTWSIGVEEQFYLLFPFFLIALRGRGDRLRAAMWAGLAISGVMSYWVTHNHPAASFYLLPTRAWEFLAGGILTLYRVHPPPTRAGAEVSAVGGLTLLLVAAAAFSGTTPYPGTAAIVPVLGTVMLLRSGENGPTAVSRMISHRVFAGVGRVSYSAYLWHWPVFTFARHIAGRRLTIVQTAVALLLVAALSFVSWKYVEQPFRRRAGSAPARMRWIVVPLAATLAVAGAMTLGGGFPARIPPQAVAFERVGYIEGESVNTCHWGVDAYADDRGFCELAGPTGVRALLWGDSHANAIAPAIEALGKARGFQVWQSTYSSCPPLLGVDIAHIPKDHRCRAFNAKVLDTIRRLQIKRVILAAYWSAYVPPVPDTPIARMFDPYSPRGSLGAGSDSENKTAFDQGLHRTIQSLHELGVEIWLIDQIPIQQEFVPDLIARTYMRGEDPAAAGVPVGVHDAESAFVHARIRGLDAGVHRIDPAASLCATGTCICFAADRILYTDSNHLSADGARYLIPALSAAFHR